LLQEKGRGPMAVVRVDDFSGEVGAETVKIMVGTKGWVVDITESTQSKIEEALAPFLVNAHSISSGAVVGGNGGRRRSRSRTTVAAANKVRTWAKENGMTVSDHGRISEEVWRAYNAANPE
jgi:hypothetical protein